MKDIIEKHRSDENRTCYAESLGPITVEHSSGRKDPRVLRCTRPLGHTDSRPSASPEDHVDGICCWRSHVFPPTMATPPNPGYRKWERCVECGQQWPCDVAKIGALITADGVGADVEIEELRGAIAAIGAAWDGGDLAGAVNNAMGLLPEGDE
jgi:hypothetical protein